MTMRKRSCYHWISDNMTMRKSGKKGFDDCEEKIVNNISTYIIS